MECRLFFDRIKGGVAFCDTPFSKYYIRLR